ncbi:MAG: sulfurtransferase [Deltaproteobacteria bacterium]|nr:sulfurtransferase [Deltaproteobacteria bacterium]HCH65165.1 rhodanese-like domain-containing protein [Deltaproteobacteria bacterium]
MAFGGWACGGSQTASPAPLVATAMAEVDVATLHAARAAGSVALVDVRTPGEYADGHVPGAVNIPVDEIPSRLAEITAHKERDLYLICRSGARSARAQGFLLDAGFANPINVAGGTRAWQSAGFSVE